MTDALAPSERSSPSRLELARRVAFFLLLVWPAWVVLGWVMLPLGGLLIASTLSTFGAGALANAISVRLFEHGRASDFGLGWTPGAGRELLLGGASGAGAAAVMLVIPLAAGWAVFGPTPETVEHRWAALIFVSIALLFGAAGEEMMFHGYAFQLLVRCTGAFATILPVSVLFGLAHSRNQNANLLGIVNTVGWGVLLGYAYWRSGALWLPIGLHFGWNLALPLFGVNMSGFSMGVTGYTLQWRVGALWSGGEYGPEGSILTTVVVIALFWLVPRVARPPESGFTMETGN